MRERLRALPLRKSHAGFYTTLDSKYAFVRTAKEGTLYAYEWVVLDNDFDGRDEPFPISFSVSELTHFKTLHEAAWMLREHGDQLWREDNGYREIP